MKLRNALSIAAACLIIAACSSKASPRYRVVCPVPSDMNGLTAYIIDYDTSAKLDSVVISDARASFSGNISDPVMARLIIDGNRAGVFVLEGGDIKIDPDLRIATGTKLNDAFTRYVVTCDSISSAFEAQPKDSIGDAARERLLNRYEQYNRETMLSNADNPLGYYIFLQNAYEMDLASLNNALKEMPQFAKYTRINNLIAELNKAAETAEGAYYKDFAVNYNDSIYKLSDYVGIDGRYTLVDFWASWCGPCIKETRTIKKLYERFGGPNGSLNVVGVAVWDKPENTLRAIKAHNLPWPQIIDAQKIPTDIYGISGIPCIILIDPYGRIVSRNKQGDELVKAVESFLLPREESTESHPADE